MVMLAEAPRPVRILWDVLEEHFEEAAYGMLSFRRALQSPVRTLADLARYPEERLIANVAGLLVGGTPVRERLLVPALTEASEDEPERLEAAAWVLMEAAAFSELEPALTSTDSWVHAALANAARHVRGSGLDVWLGAELLHQRAPARRKALLALGHARTLAVAELLATLQDPDAELVAAAARAARHVDASKLMGVMQYLLDHDDAEVRDAALLCTLAWGAQKGWLMCKAWALDPAQPSELATVLYAALGTRTDHAALQELVDDARTKRAMLFALGFSGNPALGDTLTPYLSSDDPLEARLAAQSLGLIFGFSPWADEFSVAPPEPSQAGELPPPEADPEAQATLPALENDDLEADLVPAPEEALPPPNTEAIFAFCERTAHALGTKQRVLWGQPISAQQTARVLSEGPLRVRHYLALAHGVRSGGSIWLDTCARTAVQQSSVARVAASSVQRFVGF